MEATRNDTERRDASPLWIWFWGAVTVALLAIGFTHILNFWWWAAITGVLLGGTESSALIWPNKRRPPLTDVIAQYLPRTAGITLLYAVTVAEGAKWLQLRNPVGFTVVFTLVGFLTAHFDARYDQRSREHESKKWGELRARLLRRSSANLPRARGEGVSS
jgi:hypothetical protein